VRLAIGMAMLLFYGYRASYLFHSPWQLRGLLGEVT
jgi:hypothetical protein